MQSRNGAPEGTVGAARSFFTRPLKGRVGASRDQPTRLQVGASPSRIASRLIAIDVANRSLLSDFLGMQSLRAVGMHLLGSFGPLRRLAMREGLAPTWKRVS